MDGNLPEARDRLDQPIINAIEAKNYKQALKLVEKRLAKKPADEYLQVGCISYSPGFPCNALYCGRQVDITDERPKQNENRTLPDRLNIHAFHLRSVLIT